MSARRELVPFECLAVLAIAVAWPIADPGVPVVVPLVVAAGLSRYARGHSFGELLRGGPAQLAVGAAAGVAALALALLAGTPAVEAIADRAVEWSTYPIVRGSAQQTIGVAVIVLAASVATELALRGWILERLVELGGTAPIVVTAIVEAALAQGSVASRIGAAVFGAGLSMMYLAGRRSLTAPIAARAAFQLGALTLEGLKWVG